MYPALNAGRMLAGWSHEKDSLLLQYCFPLALGQLLSSTTKGKGEQEARGKEVDGVKIGGEEAGGFLSQWISSRHPFNLRATPFLCSIFPLSFALFSSFFIFTLFLSFPFFDTALNGVLSCLAEHDRPSIFVNRRI